MGDVFKKEGLISSPLEERARYAFAVLSELVQQATGHRLPMRLDF